MVRETRAAKLVEISTEELRARQKARVTSAESEALSALRQDRPAKQLSSGSVGQSLCHAQEHIFERVSVARDYEILAEALRHGRGSIDTAEPKRNAVS